MAGGNLYGRHETVSIGKRLQMDENEARQIALYLAEENLLGADEALYEVYLTHESLKALTDGRYNEQKGIDDSSPASYVINARDIVNSQLQQGTTGSFQFTSRGELNVQGLKELSKAIRQRLEKSGLASEEKREAGVQLDTIDAQLESSRPKPTIVKEAFSSLRSVLEGVAGGVIAPEVLPWINQALEALEKLGT